MEEVFSQRPPPEVLAEVGLFDEDFFAWRR
jgi:hypothetical protein